MNKKFKVAVSSAMIAGMLLTTGAVFADSNTNTNVSQTDPVGMAEHGRMGGPKGFGFFAPGIGGAAGQADTDDLTKGLVTDGIISQETADKLSAFADEKNSERKAEMDKLKDMTEEERSAYMQNNGPRASGAKDDFWAQAVDGNILTQEQADDIKAYLEDKAEAQRLQQQKDQLDSLLKQGLITQEQEDKIVEYKKSEDAARKSEMDNIKDMTEEERAEYFDGKKETKSGGRPDAMSGLAEAGILTQDEADNISKYLEQQAQEKMEQEQQARQKEQQQRLDNLVSAGTITQDQSDAIQSYMDEQQKARQDEMEKIKDMTEDERQAYMQDKKDDKDKEHTSISPLQGLVDNGTLTQDQAKAAAESLFAGHNEDVK